MKTRCWVMVVALAGACSSEKGISSKDYNDALAKLDEANKQAERNKVAADMATKQLDECRTAQVQPGDNAYVVRVEGDTVSLVGRPKQHGFGGDIKDEVAVAVSGEFEGQVRGSKNGIQQCYVSALKKNESLQNREINLIVSVTANPTGSLTNAQFSPNVSADFTSCLSKIATHWKVKPYSGGSFTLQYPVKLRPTE